MSTSVNVSSLFGNAVAEGSLSAGAVAALDVDDIGAQIQAGLGVPVDDVKASEVLLLSILVDDSGSIACGGNEQAVRDGYNMVLQALSDSKQSEGVLVHTRYLSDNVLTPYTLLSEAPKMDNSNYSAHFNHTPLYDQSLVFLGTVLAKAQEFINNGVPVRTVTLIITDGADNSSRKGATAVAKVVKDMAMAETHIIAGMGINDGYTNFQTVFQQMGLLPSLILTPSNDPSSIRREFQVFSRSAVRASQSAKSFSQVAAGGFGQ